MSWLWSTSLYEFLRSDEQVGCGVEKQAVNLTRVGLGDPVSLIMVIKNLEMLGRPMPSPVHRSWHVVGGQYNVFSEQIRPVLRQS